MTERTYANFKKHFLAMRKDTTLWQKYNKEVNC